VKPHVYVWTCAIDKDLKLEDCFCPEIQPTNEPSPQALHLKHGEKKSHYRRLRRDDGFINS
jgi:hypothetical protein